MTDQAVSLGASNTIHLGIYDKNADSYISSAKHPESPSGKPSITCQRGLWQDSVLKKLAQDRGIVALIDPSDRDCKLEILHLVSTDIDSISQFSC